ncbi:MAG: DUF2070 family protein [Candidatus Ranarchaeia archaeon]|jgi:putative membrane protein
MTQQKNFDKAISLYQNLFSLPNSRGLILTGTITSLVFAYLVFPFSLVNFGLQAFINLAALVLSTFISFALLKEHLTLSFRRIMGLGVITIILHGILWIIPLIMNFFFPVEFIFHGGFLISLGIVATVRLIVFSALTPSKTSKTLTAGISYSLVFITLSLLFFPTIYPWSLEYVSTIIGILGIFQVLGLAFLWIVNTPAESALGIGGIKLFQGFAEEWLVGEGGILDNFFTEIGSSTTTNVSLYVFEREDKPKSGLVVPEIHPGPFKSIGSSTLSIKIQDELGKAFATPHGPSTHELNLISKEETLRVVKLIKDQMDQAESAGSTASQSFRVKNGKITILSQYFGNIGLYIATAAPEEIDDISQAVGLSALAKAREEGTEQAAFVDAHNCIGHYADSVYLNSPEAQEVINAVGDAAKKGKELPQDTLRVGVSHRNPVDITEEMGLSLGGITTYVVEAKKQQTCYVVVDSNNAIIGLRDKIRTQLLTAGFDEAELLTTDTHMASGSLSSKIGFNPLGEGGGEDLIVKEILSCAQEAQADLSNTNVKFSKKSLEVQTIGKENLDAITTLIASSAKLAKRLIIILLGFGLLAAAGVFFLIQVLFSFI